MTSGLIQATAASPGAVDCARQLTASSQPGEPSQACEAALDSVRLALRASEQRLADLAAERKPLKDEAEFYKGRALPDKLKAQIEALKKANIVRTEAQTIARHQQDWQFVGAQHRANNAGSPGHDGIC